MSYPQQNHDVQVEVHAPTRQAAVLPYYASAHIYDTSLSESVYATDWDGLLLELREALEEDLPNAGYFLVRYRDMLPHIRVRVRSDETRQPWRLCTSLSYVLGKRGIYHHNYTSERASSLDGGRWFKWYPYQREFLRYGGYRSLGVVEKIFEVTTQIALDYLQDVRPKAQPRSLVDGAALASVLASTFGLGDKAIMNAIPFSTSHHDHDADGSLDGATTHLNEAANSSRRSQTGIRALRQLSSLGYVPRDLCEELVTKARLERLEALLGFGCNSNSTPEVQRNVLWRCMPSIVHMLWNRMGLTRQEEHGAASLLTALAAGLLKD